MKKKDIILELENILGFTDALHNKKEISDERKFLILKLCIGGCIYKIIKELEREQ